MAVYCLDLGKKRLIIMIHSAQTDCRAQCPCKSNIPIMHFIDETDPAHTSHININKHDNFEGLFSVKKKKRERDLSLLALQTNKQTKNTQISLCSHAQHEDPRHGEKRVIVSFHLCWSVHIFFVLFLFFFKKSKWWLHLYEFITLDPTKTPFFYPDIK